jgi:SAM-dependent methyltransferase
MHYFIRVRGLGWCSLLLIGWLVGATVVVAQESIAFLEQAEASVKPGINKPFLDPELKVDEWLARFEVESREIYAGREEILQSLGLREGMAVADIGAGTGLFTLLMSQRVGPQGWVYAVEISPRFAQHLGQLAVKNKLTNVSPVLCGERSVRLPPASIDLAFLCDVYHHFEYPSSSLASIHRALRDNGRLVVIDFKRIEAVTREWIMGHVRAGQETVQQEIEAAGFELVEEPALKRLSENYFLVYRKKP